MKLVWAHTAEAERFEIFEYIAADNPVAALELEQLFEDRADLLADFPFMGRPGLLPDTRELTVHPNYRLVYELEDETVRILFVIHAARTGRPAEP